MFRKERKRSKRTLFMVEVSVGSVRGDGIVAAGSLQGCNMQPC